MSKIVFANSVCSRFIQVQEDTPRGKNTRRVDSKLLRKGFTEKKRETKTIPMKERRGNKTEEWLVVQRRYVYMEYN